MQVYYHNYMPIGDVLVLATCILFEILIRVAYVNRTRNFNLFRQMIVLLSVAAMSNLLFNISMNMPEQMPVILIYVFRWLYHAALFMNMVFYTLYLKEPLKLNDSEHRRNSRIVWIAYALLVLSDVLGSLLKFGFYIEDGVPYTGINIFPVAYLFFIAVPIMNAIYHKNEIYNRVIVGVVATVVLAVGMMFLQRIFGQQSFTVATYLFPMYALLYLLHATPYDIDIGAVNRTAFEGMIEHCNAKDEQVFMMSLCMHEYEVSARKFPRELQVVIRHFSSDFFKDSHLYQVSNGRIILAAKVSKNPDYEERNARMLESFDRVYPDFRLEYKIVGLVTRGGIGNDSDYIGFIQFIERRMTFNTFKLVREEDYEAYKKQVYIVRQLEDINTKRDLNDPRVLVFCQPVYNAREQKFDTAEALMRLELPESGMVFPDQFIPIAESHHYINMLTMIILSKTCAQVKKLIEEGYDVKRISVNFSMLDIRENDFCRNIKRIVEDNGIPFEKIAIEVTESQSEKDFIIIKERINELKDTGIKFYLDDFGTGYSNFDRIIELPFDIVKFDRSLVIASATDTKSQTMVSHLAHMFTDLNYAVLFEGIEDESDEIRCMNMCGRYLQGYKYSRPIPIERLKEYFEKKD